jgi:hypothetical protein
MVERGENHAAEEQAWEGYQALAQLADGGARLRGAHDKRGCARCTSRQGGSCRHPTLIHRIQQGFNHAVANYVRADMEPGSPQILPGWCPLLEKKEGCCE